MAVPTRNISLDAAWRDEYQNRRYLEYDTDEQLKARQRDILRIIFSFDREGVFSVAGHRSLWDRLMAHLYTEAELRSLELEKVLRVDGYFHAKRAAEIWAEYKEPLAPYLVKYTQRRFAEELLRLGQFRLSPADKYRDAENPAIRDTELEFSEELHGATVSAPEGADYSIPRDQWKPLPVIGNVQSKVFLESDYYTACFGNQYEYRLFDDFGADACLIIKDPPRFVEQVKQCMAQVLPGWRFSKGNVMYRDPHHPILNDSVCFSKHFRYAYQQEFRLAWQPPTKQERLNYINVAMGSIENYCDMLVL